MFRFIQTAESLKPSCISDSKVVNPDKSELEEYYPQIGTYMLCVSTQTYNICTILCIHDIIQYSIKQRNFIPLWKTVVYVLLEYFIEIFSEILSNPKLCTCLVLYHAKC